MTDYAAVLIATRPSALWSLVGDDYDGLTWLDDSDKPTQAELDAAWPQMCSAVDRAYAQAQQARHAAYVTQADPVFFRWQRGQATEQDWLDAVAAVDTAHPYPAPL
jgi:hypothetical protein